MERNPGVTASHVRQRPCIIRQRRGFWRLLRANLYDLALWLRQSWFTLTLFGMVLVVGAGYAFQHGHPDLTSALYNALQLLIFQSGEPFPGDVVGQLLFFLLPLLGLLVVVQSTLNFGRRSRAQVVPKSCPSRAQVVPTRGVFLYWKGVPLCDTDERKREYRNRQE